MQLAQSRGGENFGKPDHLAADGCILFHDRNLVSLVAKIQGRLKPCDSWAHHKGVKLLNGEHGSS